ncbi:MAG: alkaline phosphatase family protein, partial [Bryobacteraceae bacterium]
MFAAFIPSASAAVNRVVIIKLDGVPESLVERYAAERDSGGRAGHSQLPWIEHLFGENGVWMENFYTRGLSLSSPSWSMLDTGRHLEIRGNADYDRYTLRVYDYMNFFPFYLGYATNRHADMPGVALLDENGVPLLIDRFPKNERYQSFQLYQRGVRWRTLENSLKGRFARAPRELFDEWLTGFSMFSSVSEQNERELLAALRNPRIHYLDYFDPEFDHTAHLTNDPVVQLHVLQSIDALIGRIWNGIEASPLARTTALFVVSDHGMNTAPGIYSQGFNLIDWFNSAAGGAHHVLTNHHPMTEFKLKGLDPFVSEVISPSPDAAYLAGESAHYPTAVMDLDGNERASISLRNSSLNQIQILLDQLMHKKLTGRVRAAAIGALFQILDRVRPEWKRNVDDLASEVAALQPKIDKEQFLLETKFAQPASGWTKQQRAQGFDLEAKRHTQRIEAWKSEQHTYSVYVTAMRRLLSLDPADFDPGKFNTEDLIPRRSLGERNSIAELRHYAFAPAPDGLVLKTDGSLDWDFSFRYVDYFSALRAIHVRNNVQKGVAPNPVDFIAVPLKNAIWLWRDENHQALILTRRGAAGLELRYLPVANLTEDSSGEVHYDAARWCAGLPLEIFENPNLNVP